MGDGAPRNLAGGGHLCVWKDRGLAATLPAPGLHTCAQVHTPLSPHAHTCLHAHACSRTMFSLHAHICAHVHAHGHTPALTPLCTRLTLAHALSCAVTACTHLLTRTRVRSHARTCSRITHPHKALTHAHTPLPRSLATLRGGWTVQEFEGRDTCPSDIPSTVHS